MNFHFIPNRFFFLIVALLALFLLPVVAFAQDGSVPTNPIGIALSPEILFAALVLFDNRATEFIKRTFVTGNAAISDKWAGVIVLATSFVVGIVGCLLLPGINIFSGVAASPLADYILSGIVVAGLANGVDFFGGGGLVNLFSKPNASFSNPNLTSSDKAVG